MLKATYQDLFRSVFEGTPSGYVPIVLSDLDNNTVFPTEVQWYEVHEFERETFSLPIDKNSNCHVYFTPHCFKNETSLSRDAVTHFGTCVWIESDDEHFNYNAIEEARPSAVVNTSPGRNHIYWFLKAPVPLEFIERSNRQLARKYLKHDQSGWELVQLLRVPQFTNHKRQVPFDIEVVEFHPERRYDFWEVFGELPDPDPDDLALGVRDPDFQHPQENDDYLPTMEEIRTQYHTQFPSRFVTALSQRSGRRARELWYILNECHRMNMTALEAFVVAKSSPNNIFADSVYHLSLIHI